MEQFQTTTTPSKSSTTFFALAVIYLLSQPVTCEGIRRQRNLFQKITRDSDLSSFSGLVKTNRIARVNLNYEAVTVFAPTDEAFERFRGAYDQHLIYYHMSYEVKTLQQLALSQKVSSVGMSFPPLWLGRRGNDLYVNNAKIVKDKSDSLGKTGDKIQMLHVLDEVLDPVNRNTSTNTTAYQLLSTPHLWGITQPMQMFLEKVLDGGAQSVYRDAGAHTYFVPVDRHIDDHRYTHLDNYTLHAHVVPNQVLFTRPANKAFFYETACNGDYIYVLASFVERGDKIYAKSTTVLGDTDHPKGEVLAEILTPNIPVSNGVVHLISRPLVIFDREMRPFPYLSVYYKVSSDPFLEFSYDVGETTGINARFLQPVPAGKKVTYFVPRNRAWRRAFEERSYSIEEQRVILSRHLVLEGTALSMERLLHMSRASYNGSVALDTAGGERIVVNVLVSGGSYFLNFDGVFVRVHRENYACEDGVVHVLDDSPLLYEAERRGGEGPEVEADAEDVGAAETYEGADFWTYLKSLFS